MSALVYLRVRPDDDDAKSYPILAGRDLVVGRSASADVPLSEEKVSRRHAVVGIRPDGVWVEDAGSTHGVRVDGAKVARARLAVGGRFSIGQTTFELSATAGRVEPLAGSFQDQELLALLHGLGGPGASGELRIVCDGRTATMRFRSGRLHDAAIVGGRGNAERDLERILWFPRGNYVLELHDRGGDGPIDRWLAAIVRADEGVRDPWGRIDALEQLLDGRRIEPVAGSDEGLSDLALDVLAAAATDAAFESILDRVPGPAFAIAAIVVRLVERGRLKIEGLAPRVVSRVFRPASATTSGHLTEVPLVEILRLFGGSKQSAVLVLERDDGSRGRVFFDRGTIHDAEIDGDPAAAPRDAIARMCRWTDATFDALPPDPERARLVALDAVELAYELVHARK